MVQVSQSQAVLFRFLEVLLYFPFLRVSTVPLPFHSVEYQQAVE